MSVLVLDSSVAIKWFLPEADSDAATALLREEHQYLAPDLLFVELGNIVWKRVRRQELSAADGQRLTRDLCAIAVDAVPSRALLDDALPLALATGRTVYDALYLALAIRLETQVITADARFHSAVAAIPAMAPHIALLGTR
jgi:predicted nucleic acid-binding protein